MEEQWIELCNTRSETQWVDVIQGGTGNYLRFFVQSGQFFGWNRTTSLWQPFTLVQVAAGGTIHTAFVRQI